MAKKTLVFNEKARKGLEDGVNKLAGGMGADAKGRGRN